MELLILGLAAVAVAAIIWKGIRQNQVTVDEKQAAKRAKWREYAAVQRAKKKARRGR
jgi:hypothetical protein